MFSFFSLGHLGVCTKSLQSSPTLCNPVDGSLPASFVHGILQAGTLEWVAIPSFRGSSRPKDGIEPLPLHLLHRQAGSLPLAPPLGCLLVFSRSVVSSLYDPMDCSPPGSPGVHGVSQARTLECLAIPFSI